MKVCKTLFIAFLFISSLFVSLPCLATGFVEPDADIKISRLQEVLLEEVPSVRFLLHKRKLLSDIPRGFIVKRDFHYEGGRILKFINLLMKNNDKELCCQILDHINEIFFLQFHKYIGELRGVHKFIEEQINEQDGVFPDTEDKNKRKQKTVVLQKELRGQLRGILVKIYYCQSQGRKTLQYSYEKMPLSLLMTKAIIAMFRAESFRHKWGYEKQVDYVSQRLEVAKWDMFEVFDEEHMTGQQFSKYPTKEELSSFLDSFKTIFIEKRKGWPWKKMFLWTGGLTAAGIVGYLAINKLSDALRNVGSSAATEVRKAAREVGADTLGINVNGKKEDVDAVGSSGDSDAGLKQPETMVSDVEDVNASHRSVSMKIRKSRGERDKEKVVDVKASKQRRKQRRGPGIDVDIDPGKLEHSFPEAVKYLCQMLGDVNDPKKEHKPAGLTYLADVVARLIDPKLPESKRTGINYLAHEWAKLLDNTVESGPENKAIQLCGVVADAFKEGKGTFPAEGTKRFDAAITALNSIGLGLQKMGDRGLINLGAQDLVVATARGAASVPGASFRGVKNWWFRKNPKQDDGDDVEGDERSLDGPLGVVDKDAVVVAQDSQSGDGEVDGDSGGEENYSDEEGGYTTPVDEKLESEEQD